MKLENQVVSLELAKELKSTGYKQDGLWWWGETSHKLKYLMQDFESMSKNNKVTAPTVAELGEYLGKGNLTDYNTSNVVCSGWFECYHHTLDKPITADTEANARAKMWLYLKKENLL